MTDLIAFAKPRPAEPITDAEPEPSIRDPESDPGDRRTDRRRRSIEGLFRPHLAGLQTISDRRSVRSPVAGEGVGMNLFRGKAPAARARGYTDARTSTTPSNGALLDAKTFWESHTSRAAPRVGSHTVEPWRARRSPPSPASRPSRHRRATPRAEARASRAAASACPRAPPSRAAVARAASAPSSARTPSPRCVPARRAALETRAPGTPRGARHHHNPELFEGLATVSLSRTARVWWI